MKINAKNYICINGKIAHIGDYEFIVIKTDEKLGTTELLMKYTLGEDMIFGSTNDYRTSKIKKVLDEFANEISEIIGKENLVEHIVDLTADDGLKCYGSIKAKMSLFTANMVRENVEILDEFKLDKYWWTCTPYSTPKHESSTWVKCVSPRGDIDYYFSDVNYFGVRPFCIVKSSIFVS